MEDWYNRKFCVFQYTPIAMSKTKPEESRENRVSVGLVGSKLSRERPNTGCHCGSSLPFFISSHTGIGQPTQHEHFNFQVVALQFYYYQSFSVSTVSIIFPPWNSRVSFNYLPSKPHFHPTTRPSLQIPKSSLMCTQDDDPLTALPISSFASSRSHVSLSNLSTPAINSHILLRALIVSSCCIFHVFSN